MNISDEAVVSAAKAYSDQREEWEPDPITMAGIQRAMRYALEAAAPHLIRAEQAMNISDKAVEMAAFAQSERDRPGMWVHETESYKEALRRDARLHLEAAAPHLMAEAWDQCAEAYEGRRQEPGSSRKPPLVNPYRSVEVR
jgi:hypothetical protein